MTAARLFPDMAAAPTRRERAAAREEARRGQGTLFEALPAGVFEAPRCPVCAGEHFERDCEHGSAPTLPELDDDDEQDALPIIDEESPHCDHRTELLLLPCTPSHPSRQVDAMWTCSTCWVEVADTQPREWEDRPRDLWRTCPACGGSHGVIVRRNAAGGLFDRAVD